MKEQKNRLHREQMRGELRPEDRWHSDLAAAVYPAEYSLPPWMTEEELEAQTVDNPWIRNLPRRPRRSQKGLVLFLVLMALLLVVVGGVVWLALLGDTPAQTGESWMLRQEAVVEPTIQRISGGAVRLSLEDTQGAALSAGEVYQAVNPAVVTVVTYDAEGAAAVGSGVFFSEAGYFLTNAHVIAGAETCTVLLADGKRYECALVGYDNVEDVAVLRAMGQRTFPAAEFGNSALSQVGDTVYAIGNPLGTELRGTLTDGILSAVDRKVSVGKERLSMLQTNAALNQGNSGGPLINEFGQVIGLNTSKMSAASGEVGIEGLGFSIPSARLVKLVNEIMEYGKTLPGVSLGISVSEMAADVDANRRGLLVREVSEGSGAAAAGICVGDVILAADGQRTEENDDLLAVRDTHTPGEALVLIILRGETELELTVILDEA